MSSTLLPLHSSVTEQSAIIIDLGTGSTKSGIASQDAPRSQFPTIIGKPKLPSIMVGMQHKDSYIGNQAKQKQNILYIKHPIKNGMIQKTGWQDITQILHHIYYGQNRITPEEHPCMIAETPKNSIENRHKLTQIMFQTMNIPYFYLANQSVLSLFAVGKTTGLVVDSGAGVSTSVPIYQGYAIPHAIKRNNFAGNNLDNFIIEELSANNVIKNRLNPYLHYEALIQIKSKIICNNGQASSQEKYSGDHNLVELPDGQIINIASINKQCGQLLFSPEKYNFSNVLPIQSLVSQTIKQCDKDILSDLLHNIITCGGLSNMLNFSNTLEKQLSSIYKQQNIQIKSKQDQGQFLPWLGGSILSSLQSFQNMWVSKQEYMENGVSIVDKKCF